MLCIVVICRCIASQLVKWRGVFGCRKGNGDGDRDGNGNGNGNVVSVYGATKRLAKPVVRVQIR